MAFLREELPRFRFRVVMMIALSFILGVLPLVFASGAGAASRVSIGFVAPSGMVAAALVGVVFVPVLYTVVERVVGGGERPARSSRGRQRPTRPDGGMALAGGREAIPPSADGSPDAPHTVSVEYLVDGHQRQPSRHGLGNEHTIERIAMRTRKPSGAFCILDRDWQLLEALARDGACHVLRHGRRFRELADAVLGGDLPRGRGTHDDVVGRVFHGAAGAR